MAQAVMPSGEVSVGGFHMGNKSYGQDILAFWGERVDGDELSELSIHDVDIHDIEIPLQMTDAGSVFVLVKNAATLTHEAHFCTSVCKVRYGEEVPAQVGDV